MKLNVRYFGLVAEAAGKQQEILEFSEGVSAAELLTQLVKKYHIPDAESVQVAVNQNLDKNAVLKDGDEVALLPPFAGG
ncbi:MAG: molybdopterin synthase sulfur carrier subunit [Cytophagaceae bacterium]|nr:molybdopterin synthase sulfur carrier subunit [Cytophagaceae bacterium]